MAKVDVPLPDHMKAFVESQADKLGFTTVSEYLQSLLLEIHLREALQELDAESTRGIDSGPEPPHAD